MTSRALEASKGATSHVQTSAARIEKAAVSKDGQLCVFFENDSTNSAQNGRFTLVLPLALIQTNRPAFGILFRDTDGTRRTATYHILHVPGDRVRKDWTLLQNPDKLAFFPIEAHLSVGNYSTYGEAKSFVLLPNAQQTLYFTRTSPIELVYVEASTNREFTILTVDPIPVTQREPKYYFLLPLTVPADIATSPFQLVAGLLFLAMLGHSHC